MRFLRVRDVVQMVGFSKTTLYARVRAGRFPKSIHLGPATTAFLESEVLDWMKSQTSDGCGRPTVAGNSGSREVRDV